MVELAQYWKSQFWASSTGRIFYSIEPVEDSGVAAPKIHQEIHFVQKDIFLHCFKVFHCQVIENEVYHLGDSVILIQQTAMLAKWAENCNKNPPKCLLIVDIFTFLSYDALSPWGQAFFDAVYPIWPHANIIYGYSWVYRTNIENRQKLN